MICVFFLLKKIHSWVLKIMAGLWGMELVFILVFWPEDPEMPESILELQLVHCFPSGRFKNTGNLVQVNRKLAKMVWSGSLAPGTLDLAPGFVDNDYVTAEFTYRLCVWVMRYWLLTGYFVWYTCTSFTMKALATAG